MPGMRTTAGDYRFRVTIRKPNATQASDGQPIEDWTADAGVIARDVPAGFISVSAGERVRGVQVEAGETAMFPMRWRSDVYEATDKTSFRLYLGTEAWNVVRAIDPDHRRHRLLVTASRVP